MKREAFNLPEDGTDLGTPRFDEQAKEAARPVVPLSQVDGTEFNTGSARRQRATFRGVSNGWPRGLVLILALAAVVAAATAVAVYRNTSATMAPDSPQAVNAATSTIATDSIAAPASTRPSEDDASDALSKSQRGFLPQSGSAVRHEPVKDNVAEDERRERHDDDEWDEEKIAKRERKEEKKRLERGRKEAEKLAERGRDSSKRGEPKPRLVGIYTEKN